MVPGTHDLFDVVDMQIALSIGKTANYPLVFDLGFPGLRLAVRENPAVPGDELVATVAWRIDLAFGISRTDGFYLRTDNPLRPGTPEITVGPSIDLPDTITGDLRVPAGDAQRRVRRPRRVLHSSAPTSPAAATTSCRSSTC